ncbi:MAG: type 1 glutamine amidotransferase [Chitinivibrionales bacterium]
MMRLHYFQHVVFEGIGCINAYARNKGFLISGTRIYKKDPFPGPDDFDWLIIMGGPMGVHDERVFPWIIDEQKCIERAIRANKKILGICLGAQLIADVLGAKVYANRTREIGWFPVTLSGDAHKTGIFHGISDRFIAFHWHGDTFDIPRGALHIAMSEACANQAFVYDGHVMGLQFHCESTAESITALIDNCGNEIHDGSSMQKAEAIRSNFDRIPEINTTMSILLDNLLHFANPPSSGF